MGLVFACGRFMSAKETQNGFSSVLITEMCPVPFHFSLLQQDPADHRLNFFDRRQRHESSYARMFFSLASYIRQMRNIFITTCKQPMCNMICVRACVEAASFKCVIKSALLVLASVVTP